MKTFKIKQLNDDYKQKQKNVMKQTDMCDPQKLKGQYITFNNKFLKYLREFYNDALALKVEQ